jgi:hypothetical protein
MAVRSGEQAADSARPKLGQPQRRAAEFEVVFPIVSSQPPEAGELESHARGREFSIEVDQVRVGIAASWMGADTH